jgi:MFS transporter, ACS family, hexuronate transporter
MALKWKLCLLLFLATTLNYLDRQTVSILAPTLQKELHLDNAALGWLFAVFYYSYTFAQVAVGPLLDRFHLRWAFGAAVVLWSAVSVATGLVSGFAGLIAFRLLLGVAEAGNWPGATRVVARTFEPAERSMANGIFTSGTSAGALFAPALIFAISAAFGWRSAFVLLGFAGGVWFLVWVLSTGSPRLEHVWHDDVADSRGSREKFPRVFAQIVRSPRFWPVLAVAVLINPCLYFSVNWLPTYFAQQRGLLPGRQLGGILTAIYLGLGVGNLLCGAGVLALARRGRTLAAARRLVFLAATVPVAACAAVPFLPQLSAAVAVLVAANIGLGIWLATYLTLVQDVSTAHVSTALGVLSGSGSLAGAFAMWAVGRVTQSTGSFVLPMAACSLAAVISAVAAHAATREPALVGHPEARVGTIGLPK